MSRHASLMLVLVAWGAGCDLFPATPPLSQLGDEDASAGGSAGSAGSGGTANSAGFAGQTGGASGGGAGGAGAEGGTDAGGAGAGGEAGAATVDLDIFVSTGEDDVTEDGSAFDASGSTVWVGTGENPDASYAGLRFDKVKVPKGATILEAKLELFDSEGQWTSLDLEIAAEASSSCKAFKQNKPPSGRPLTATVSHVSDEAWAAGEYNLVEDVRGPMQEVVSMSGWSKGNPLCVIVKGRGAPFGRKFGSSFEGGEAPRLRVRYEM